MNILTYLNNRIGNYMFFYDLDIKSELLNHEIIILEYESKNRNLLKNLQKHLKDIPIINNIKVIVMKV